MDLSMPIFGCKAIPVDTIMSLNYKFLAAIYWNIWMEYNIRIFKNTSQTVCECLSIILLDIHAWIGALSNGDAKKRLGMTKDRLTTSLHRQQLSSMEIWIWRKETTLKEIR